MKSLIRWSTTAALVSTTLVGSLALGGLKVLALSPDQIVQKLRSVPVFTIANGQGAPLVASPPNGQKGTPVTGVFISPKDAQTFLSNLQSKNPSLAKEVKVVPVSLAEIYQLSQKTSSDKEKLSFSYVPTKQQLDAAVALVKQNGQQVKQFAGTPLFAARAGKDKGFLTIQEGDKSVIPMFFSKEDLQPLLERFKKQKPNDAATADIAVYPLEGVMEAMKRDKDPQLEKIVLIPPRESVEFIQSQKPQSGSQAQPNAPVPAPQLGAPQLAPQAAPQTQPLQLTPKK